MTQEQIKRAKWVWLSRTTKALQASKRDGGKVLAIVKNVGFMRSGCEWQTVDGTKGCDYLPTTAMKAARAALLAVTP